MNVRKAFALVLCGLSAGVTSFLVKAPLLSMFGAESLAIVESAPYTRFGSEYFFVIDLLMGIWAVCVYALIASRTGFMKGSAITAMLWWSMKTLQSAQWVGLGVFPMGLVVAPGLISLCAASLATLLGAFLYHRVSQRGARSDDGVT